MTTFLPGTEYNTHVVLYIEETTNLWCNRYQIIYNI